MDSKLCVMNSDAEADDNLNGFIFNSVIVPREILEHILSYVCLPDLVCNCRLVCNAWNDVIIDDVRKLKVKQGNYKSFSKLNFHERTHLNLPTSLFYMIFLNDPFEKNLLLNNCGENELKHWNVTKPERHVRNVFKIEKTPIGSDALPSSEEFGDNTSCFSTTYYDCEKEQVIDLQRFGIFPHVMDEFQPKITVSEWYAGRFDCGCVYKLEASLLDEKRSVLHSKEKIEYVNQWEGREWSKVIIEFENYGPGVRYIVFQHYGKDTQFWAGYFGSKMAGGVVKLSLPNVS